MISTPLSPGTLLLPNDYLIANNKPISGISIDVVDDLWGKNYKIFLSNGKTMCVEEGSIADLWNVVK